jgi:hypothetical protein
MWNGVMSGASAAGSDAKSRDDGDSVTPAKTSRTRELPCRLE